MATDQADIVSIIAEAHRDWDKRISLYIYHFRTKDETDEMIQQKLNEIKITTKNPNLINVYEYKVKPNFIDKLSQYESIYHLQYEGWSKEKFSFNTKNLPFCIKATTTKTPSYFERIMYTNFYADVEMFLWNKYIDSTPISHRIRYPNLKFSYIGYEEDDEEKFSEDSDVIVITDVFGRLFNIDEYIQRGYKFMIVVNDDDDDYDEPTDCIRYVFSKVPISEDMLQRD